MNEQSLVNNYKTWRKDNFYDKEGFFFQFLVVLKKK